MSEDGGSNGSTEKPRPFYYIPFGRYEGSRRAEFPANEVLVGREKQRAEFLKHLFAAGRRGAYLITGHRGSGKTSFVRHCLDEYEEDVFQRYLQRNVGRAFFWDRIGQAAVLGLFLVLGLLLSELAAHLIEVLNPGLLKWAILTILAVALSYPFVMASRAFSTAFYNVLAPAPNLVGPLVTLLLAPWFLLIVPVAAPATAMAQFFLILSLTFVATQVLALSKKPEDDREEWPTDDPSVSLDELGPVKWGGILLVAAGALAAPLFLPGPEPAEGVAGPFPDLRFAATYTICALTLFAVGLLIRCLTSRGLYDESEGGQSEGMEITADAVSSTGKWHFLAAVITQGLATLLAMISSGLPTQPHDIARVALWIGPFLIAASLVLWLVVPARLWPLKSRLHPRPGVLLALKGTTLIAGGMILALPVLRHLVQKIPGIDRLVEESARYTWDLRDLVQALVSTCFPDLAAKIGSANRQLTLPDQIESTSLPFVDLSQEGIWLTTALVLVVFFNGLEYQWIVRPFSKLRNDFAIQRRGPGKGPHTGLDRHEQLRPDRRERYRRMLRETFFYRIHRIWLPVLRVQVNLGFDLLDHRLVIEAMLTGLRNAYRRYFLQWRSPFAAMRKTIAVVALLILSVLLGYQLFGVESARQLEWLRQRAFCREYVDPGFGAYETRPRMGLWLACRLGGETAVQALTWAPFEDVAQVEEGAGTEADNLLALAFHLGEPVPRDILDIRLHTWLLFGLLAFLLTRLSRRWSIPPYHRMEERMCEILDGLSRTLRYEVRPQSSPLAVWLASFSGREEIQQKEGGPFDPRTVELEFIELLEDLQDPAVQVPLGSRFRVSPPIPEIVFVFDELDKVGLGLTPLAEPGPEMDATEPLDQERERSRALHKLFGDLKNTISSAKARFVFIGGRNLHDEWLGDQTARRPLLTHIFDLELYVPSLLTDLQNESAAEVHGVRAFLRRQAYRARQVYRRSKRKRLRSLSALWVEDLQAPTFVQLRYARSKRKDEAVQPGEPWPCLDILESKTASRPLDQERFEEDLVHFLAYRSKGNVKRLRELLESFLEPKEFRGLNQEVDCDHILAFGERDRYRIQLIADLYRQLGAVLDARIRLQDDKIPQAILYMSDFLLKFHRRAFAWSNIERVDELVHIHRAPDLRNAVEEIITGWNDRFLHRIRNGMYDFRCTSEFARELEYASRCSEQELAALNFTLDESQFLKAIYRSRIEILGDESGLDFIAGLAELHKFDEEYELARSYLRRAIAVLDQRYRKEMQEWSIDNPIRDGLQASGEGLVALRTRLSWGTTRIRLMLQVGMTFERARNLEHAVLEYREARTLATSLIAALSGWLEEAPRARNRAKLGESPSPLADLLEQDPARGEFISTLKHLNILYQPTFAEAWAVEKLMTGVDTGPALVDAELWSLRQMLPFVSAELFARDLDSKGPLGIQHSNFSLVMAELHNKAGDLFFFKGRQLVELDLAREWCEGVDPELQERRKADGAEGAKDTAFEPNKPPGEGAKRKGAEGYLIRATDHYCTALHDLRRYTVYRRRSSSHKFGMPTRQEKHLWRTIEPEGWSDFVRRVAAGTLADLADSQFARFSYTGLLLDLNDHGVRQSETAGDAKLDEISFDKKNVLDNLRKPMRGAYDLVVDWLEGETNVAGEVVPRERKRERERENRFKTWSSCIEALVPSLCVPTSSLNDWFADPQSPQSSARTPGRLLSQRANNRDSERLVSSLMLSIVGARMMARGGYYEAAAAQLTRVAAAVSHVLWWRLSMQAVAKSFPLDKPPFDQRDRFFQDFHVISDLAEEKAAPFFADLLLIGVLALDVSRHYLRHVRKEPTEGTGEGREVLAAELIPLACSLGLAGELAGASADPATGSRNRHLLATEALKELMRGAPDFLRGENGRSSSASLDFREMLDRHRKVQRYPMLDQLHCLKILVDHAAIKSLRNTEETESDTEASDTLERLRDGAREYGSPLHFTPLELGSSLALAWLDEKRSGTTRKWMRIEALEQLMKSQQMYTLQGDFYRSIGGLYYLYDDFNDRSVHFHHGIQMAGTEFASFLRRRLELLDDHSSSDQPSPVESPSASGGSDKTEAAPSDSSDREAESQPPPSP